MRMVPITAGNIPVRVPCFSPALAWSPSRAWPGPQRRLRSLPGQTGGMGWASGLLASRPSRTAAFIAERSVARTRSTVEAAMSLPLRVRWRASRLKHACRRLPVRSARVIRPMLCRGPRPARWQARRISRPAQRHRQPGRCRLVQLDRRPVRLDQLPVLRAGRDQHRRQGPVHTGP